MSERKDMPAFPVWELNGQGQQEMTWFGMSTRDYFAAKAMQSWVSDDRFRFEEGQMEEAARFAYAMADHMLAARERS